MESTSADSFYGALAQHARRPLAKTRDANRIDSIRHRKAFIKAIEVDLIDLALRSSRSLQTLLQQLSGPFAFPCLPSAMGAEEMRHHHITEK